MENASKALLIAGGLLLAMMIISVLVFVYKDISDIKKAEIDRNEQTAIENYNKEYEVFNKRYLYGTEVLTARNKVKENNQKNDNIITIQILKDDGTDYDLDDLDEIKLFVFTCEEMAYSNITGKVNNIVFKRNT